VPQGRLPEIEVLQGQLTSAHEELSDARFRAEELRAATAAREQQVGAVRGTALAAAGGGPRWHRILCAWLRMRVPGHSVAS
jgi:hypothetical protein